MSTWIGPPIQVYALTQRWRFNITQSGITGTRVYLETTSTLPNATLQTLPVLGSAWDDVYTGVTAKGMEVTYVNDNDNCGKLYTVSYDDVLNIQTPESISKEDLPRNISISGELISVEPKNSSYKWLDGTAVKQPIFKKVSNADIVVSRVVKDLDTYMGYVWNAVNYTNDEMLWQFPAGALLFTGAEFTEFRNRNGFRRWRVDLHFVGRKVRGDLAVGANAWGWNTILREDTGKWDTPLLNGDASKPLYTTIGNFNLLFEGDPLGDDENLMQIVPNN